MIQGALIRCAENGRLLLMAGLALGLCLPGPAGALAPYLAEMVAVLLIITAMRIGPRAAFGAVSDLRWSLPAVLMLQLAVPLALAGCFAAAGILNTPLAFALCITSAAPTISGGASLAILLRQDPARMMQLLVIGMIFFPVTVLPILALFPQAGGGWEPALAALRAAAVILGASLLGFVLRAMFLPEPGPAQTRALDGAVVLAFAVIVIGLMSPLGPVILTEPLRAAGWAAAAFALGFGLQWATLAALRPTRLRDLSGPLALAAGNRNLALFLVALPPDVIAPILLFVGCWQLPMYLTPLLLPRLYRRAPAHAA